jgi:hypothetical protein
MADVLNQSLMRKRLRYTEGQVPGTPQPKLRLFANNVAVSPINIPSDFLELSATGYAAVALTPGNWTNALGTNAYTGTYLTVTFSMTAGLGQTVYGYYVTDETDSTVMFAGSFAQPFAIPDAGGQVAVTPTFTDQQCP